MKAFPRIAMGLSAFLALAIPFACKQSVAVVGDQGPQGPAGPQGPQGLAGSPGQNGAAPMVNYGEQDAGVAVSTVTHPPTGPCPACTVDWVTLGEVDFTAASSTFVDLSAVGAVASSATSGTTICGFRFAIPILGLTTTSSYGDMSVLAPSGSLANTQFVSVNLTKRFQIPVGQGGTFRLPVQIGQISADPNNCYVDGNSNTQFRIYATVGQ